MLQVTVRVCMIPGNQRTTELGHKRAKRANNMTLSGILHVEELINSELINLKCKLTSL